jgi:hypothetical protein
LQFLLKNLTKYFCRTRQSMSSGQSCNNKTLEGG